MHIRMYVCMYVCICVWMLMEGSLSFGPNNAILTQNIHEDTGCVINYIRPTSVQNWLKNKFFKKGLVYFEFMLGLL